MAHTVKMSSVLTTARPNIILYAKTKSARIRLNSRLSRPSLTGRDSAHTTDPFRAT